MLFISRHLHLHCPCQLRQFQDSKWTHIQLLRNAIRNFKMHISHNLWIVRDKRRIFHCIFSVPRKHVNTIYLIVIKEVAYVYGLWVSINHTLADKVVVIISSLVIGRCDEWLHDIPLAHAQRVRCVLRKEKLIRAICVQCRACGWCDQCYYV